MAKPRYQDLGKVDFEEMAEEYAREMGMSYPQALYSVRTKLGLLLNRLIDRYRGELPLSLFDGWARACGYHGSRAPPNLVIKKKRGEFRAYLRE